MTDDRLRGLIQAVEAYNFEIGDAIDGRRGVYEQAKAMGYDVRTMRNLIRRRRMVREDREAADELLAKYECDLGIEGGAAAMAEASPPPRKREPFTAPPDASSEQQLRAIISCVLELRAERVGAGQTIRLELKKAKVAGFDPRKITEACIWLERCDKHGRDRMLASEELFQIYRDIGDGPQPAPAIEGDAKLVALFAAPAAPEARPVSAKVKQVSDAVAAAQMNRMMRGE